MHLILQFWYWRIHMVSFKEKSPYICSNYYSLAFLLWELPPSITFIKVKKGPIFNKTDHIWLIKQMVRVIMRFREISYNKITSPRLIYFVSHFKIFILENSESSFQRKITIRYQEFLLITIHLSLWLSENVSLFIKQT